MFGSPNGRYIVYTTGAIEQLAIADRQQLHFFTFPFGVSNPFLGPDRFNILWSDDSATFVMKSEPGEGVGYIHFYIHNYENNLSDAISEWIGTFTVNSRDFGVEQVYDLSSDDRLVLLRAYDLTNADTVRLIVLNAANPNGSQIIETLDGKNIAGASFAI